MLAQVLLNGLIAGSTYALIGLSFGLIYMPTRFFHFAHGVVYAAGAYGTLAAISWLNLPLSIAVLVGVGTSTVMGLTIECTVYRALRRRSASSLVFLLTSLGLYIVLQNSISLFFGDYIQSIRIGAVEEGIDILGARITPAQILIVSMSLALTVAVTILLKRTKMGRAIRAVANDAELADISGINRDKVFFRTFAIGSALAGVAGILVAFDSDFCPTMGINALMMGVVAVIIGGGGSIPGITLGALLIGMAQQFGVWKIGSQWQDAIAFVVLLIFLLFRPQGFLGKKVKKVTL